MSIATTITEKFSRRKQQQRPPRPRPDRAAGTDPRMSLPVPAAQVRAQRESGPQPALPVRQPMFTPRPPVEPWEQEYAQRFGAWIPQGEHPYGAPSQNQAAPPGEYPAAGAPTASFQPDFAQAGELTRPYAPQNHPLDPQTRIPEEDMPEPLFGDWLAEHWPPLPPATDKALEETWPDLAALRYPARDLSASCRDYASLMRQVDEITGTSGAVMRMTGEGLPTIALPAPDRRWWPLALSVAKAAHVRAGTDPERSGAYKRLHEAVTAAPDCETALRLAALAAEAGIVDRRDLEMSVELEDPATWPSPLASGSVLVRDIDWSTTPPTLYTEPAR